MKAVNLLPPDLRGTTKKPAAAAASPGPQASGGKGPFVVLGVLAFAVLAVAAYVLTTNTIKDRRAELAQVKADHAATIAQANALKPYADFANMATARVATVNALATSRFDWEQALRDLSRALPSDVHLTKLDGNLGAANGAAASGSALRGAITAPAISLQGCTQSHSDVARMMSRLRNVRGVTRVSLASSDKDATSTSGTAAPVSTDGGTPAQLCPKGTPPTFDVVVFFEGASAPASAPAAGSTAPAASATPAPGATATPAPGATATPSASGAATTPASTTAQGGSAR